MNFLYFNGSYCLYLHLFFTSLYWFIKTFTILFFQCPQIAEAILHQLGGLYGSLKGNKQDMYNLNL